MSTIKWKDSKRIPVMNSVPTDDVSESFVHCGRVRISVHRHAAHRADQWFLTDTRFFTCKKLASSVLAEAKAEALSLVKGELEQALNDVLSVIKSVTGDNL